ncbi:Por secretion system C-terminal sorting domain-containing protein [Chryseobacterium oleae]|uniref:Por secretion system C-terminal sorting domain-containing protein n=2 Tax=Chryseobacterium oleae TaxID=491207 RepID=A0A1I4W4D1_CHROL|nr:Por secretion system C-terminal sorting domain-containing protein [Chryseobacterium oleae]
MLLLFSVAAKFQSAGRMDNIDAESAFTVPTNLVASNISFTSADITWDPIPGATGYTVRWLPVGSAVWFTMSISSGTTSVNLNGLTPCSGYIVQVVDTASGDVSFPLTFYTHLNYCESTSANLGVLYLSNVKITPSGGLPAMVNDSYASNYTNFRSNLTHRIQLGIGSVNNVVSVEPSWTGIPGTAYIKAWIDFNANAIFEASEMIISTTVDSTNPKAFVFNVPPFVSITQCGTAMRVIISQAAVAGPCGTFPYGEVEDYRVDFVNSNLAVNETAKSKEITIYPNPASEVLHISGLSSEADYEIFSVSGQKTGEGRTSENAVDICHLAKGIYFIQLKNKENTPRLKFIKK